ncbi:MAG: PKD domain-containing protein [Candidatus Thorarchaeota archaeon]
MAIQTIYIDTNADGMMWSTNPTLNYGGFVWNVVGVQQLGGIMRGLMRFKVPKFVGNILSAELQLRAYDADPIQLGFYILKSPTDDLWIEGVSNGIVDPRGYSWNDFAKGFGWSAGGAEGDYDNLVGIYINSSYVLWEHTVYIPLDIENFTFNPNKNYTFLLKSTNEIIADVSVAFATKEAGSTKARLVLEIEIDNFDIPTLSAETISSTQLDLSWDKTELDDDNFTHYLLEQSDTGVGGWTTLATITDKDTVKYEHTGLVGQGNVDDYDEDNDTYPNGRTKYYRLSVVSDIFGATGYGIADATTIPAIRPVSLLFSPKSKYWDEDFIDDNLIYAPYGVEIIPEWYDDNDITDENYIDKLTVEAYFRGVSSWPGTASETNDFTPVDFISGGIIKGDVGFKPYKVKGKIYDSGGLYRKATTDKTTEQFDVAWPSPCPVAIPDGAYADAPPALNGRPFASGDLVPIDLSVAGQQSGEIIFKDDFAGAPGDDGKWGWTISGATAPVYGTGVGGAPVMKTTHNGAPTLSTIYKKLLGQTSPSNNYDKYLSKYTGGYRLKKIFRFDTSWTFGSGLYFIISTTAFDNITPGHGSKSGYELHFNYGQNNMKVYRQGNFVVDHVLLASFGIGGVNSPLLPINKGKFIYFDIIISPYFGLSGEGDVITIIYNIDTTLAGVQNIDYKTHPYIYTLISNNHNPADQQHYTGRNMILVSSLTTPQTNAIFEIYDVDIIGRVNGQGYGAKNLTNEQILDLVNSPIPSFPISCAPDLASQLCYIEGRIKNEYGAQSRTGEVDDYQGDTFNNAIPIGFLSVSKTGFVGADVLIDASQSIDPEGGTLIYKYDFGDTETLETSQSSVSHQYTSAGTYTVKLIVEDEAGLLSVEVQSVITIYDALGQFEEVSLMSPWESISDSSPPGTSKTSHPELDYDTVQTMDGGNRVFSLTGQHHDPDCDIDLATRMTNAEEEKDYFHTLYNKSKLITLDLVFFGKVRGVITDHKPSMAVDDQQAFQFSMTFQEIDVRQFE